MMPIEPGQKPDDKFAKAPASPGAIALGASPASMRADEAGSSAFEHLNFRDLGGLPVEDGGRVRHGQLYRCAGPASFTDAHRSALAPLRVRLVCDLRSGPERERAAHDWGTSACLVNLDLPDDFGGDAALGREIVRSDPTETGARRAMRTSYAAMPAAIRPHLPAIVDAIECGSTPLLIHCTAGKDRTGVLTALLLTLLGVPRDSVVADYLRSRSFGDRLRARGGIVEAFSAMYGVPLDQPTVDAIIGVEGEYILAALAQVDADWGSVEGYFASVGITRTQTERLRASLTEPLAPIEEPPML